MKIGIIGAGNLGIALARNVSGKAEVVAVKRNVVEIEGINITSRMEDVEGCDVIFVTLKPDVFREEMERIGEIVGDAPLVSFAAGVKLSEMKKYIEKPYRAMTNIEIEQKSLVAYYPEATIKNISFLNAEFIECHSEDELELMTAYIGSSPGILAYLMHAFILAAIKDGISYDRSLKIAASSFRAVAGLYERYGLEGMLKRIATPGGTTVEGAIRILENQKTLIDALLATSSKAKVL